MIVFFESTLNMIKFPQTHPNGKSFEIKTGDRQVVTVLLREPLNEPLSGLVEVQGLGQGKGQVQCDYFIPFSNEIGETFGM